MVISASIISPSHSKDSLEEVALRVRETINQSMKDLLGESGAQAASFHIGLTAYEKEPREFHVRLISMFHQGSDVIERMIIKDLYRKLDIPSVAKPMFNYEESVRYAMRVLQERANSTRRR